jgi:hypothetical protein
VYERNEENLRELLRRFMDPEQAQKNLEDIEAGEQILQENPAPEPDDMLLANIKAEIALHVLPHRATIYKRIAFKVTAVAAAVIILATLWTSSLNENPVPKIEEPLIASVFPWDHQDSAVFNTKLELIENDLRALESGEEDQDDSSAVTELELEVTEIAGDFWKG